MTQPPPKPGYGVYAGSVVDPEQRDVITSGLARGLSGAAIQRTLQAAGKGLRSIALYDVIREIQGGQARARSITNTPLNFHPSEGAFIQTNRVQRTRYRVVVNHPLPLENAAGKPYISAVLSFNHIPTHAELNARAINVMQNAVDAYELELASESLDYELGTYYPDVEVI